MALVTFVLGWSIPAFRYFEVIKAYRLIKLLRLFGWTDLDLLVKVITNSFLYTFTIIGLLLFILGMMALLGQGLFQGTLHYQCVSPAGVTTRICSPSVHYGYQCPPPLLCRLSPSTPAIRKFNFGMTNYDNMISAWLTSFQLLQKSDWQDIMYIYRDA